MYKGTYVHTITAEDVENFTGITKRTGGKCDFFMLKDTLGTILSLDIGKQVWLQTDGNYYSIESVEQRDKRIATGGIDKSRILSIMTELTELEQVHNKRKAELLGELEQCQNSTT